MNKQEILEFFYTNSEELTPVLVLLVLCMALCAAAVIYLTYRFTTEPTVYSQSFNVGNVVLTLITTVIMLMISSNIVISLGMVGALSIVRFRTCLLYTSPSPGRWCGWRTASPCRRCSCPRCRPLSRSGGG